jgi:hypothetical protein
MANDARPNPSVIDAKMLVVNVVIALVFGAMTVATLFGLNFLVACAWGSVLYEMVRSLRRSKQGKKAAMTAAIQITVMTLVVVAAWHAPVKLVDRMLDRQIELPRTEFALSELMAKEEPELFDLPHMRLPTASHHEGEVVTFPSTKLTIREFISIVEHQSTLRHRYANCANGWSILWGNDGNWLYFVEK